MKFDVNFEYEEYGDWRDWFLLEKDKIRRTINLGYKIGTLHDDLIEVVKSKDLNFIGDIVEIEVIIYDIKKDDVLFYLDTIQFRVDNRKITRSFMPLYLQENNTIKINHKITIDGKIEWGV